MTVAGVGLQQPPTSRHHQIGFVQTPVLPSNQSEYQPHAYEKAYAYQCALQPEGALGNRFLEQSFTGQPLFRFATRCLLNAKFSASELVFSISTSISDIFSLICWFSSSYSTPLAFSSLFCSFSITTLVSLSTVRIQGSQNFLVRDRKFLQTTT